MLVELSQPEQGACLADFGWRYVSPKAAEDRAVTCPESATYGCPDLWAPDLYGDFAGVCVHCGYHFPMAAAGQKSGPKDGQCKGCHNAAPDVISDWQSLTVDKRLHFRHAATQEKAENKCGACHLVYSEAAGKVVPVTKPEDVPGACVYCHAPTTTTVPGRKPETIRSLRLAVHGQCVTCHLDTAAKGPDVATGPVTCAGCHSPSGQEAIARHSRERVPADADLRIKRGQPDLTMYAFLTGPMLWLSFAICLIGCVWRVVAYVRGLDWQLDRVPYGYFRNLAVRGALRSIFHWLAPYASRSWRLNPIYTAAFFLFHIGLVIVPLFLYAHGVILLERFGIPWPALPAGLADGLTILAMGPMARKASRAAWENEENEAATKASAWEHRDRITARAIRPTTARVGWSSMPMGDLQEEKWGSSSG